MIDFIKSFWMFLRSRKKFWLLPVLLVMGLFGVLVAVAGGSAVGPFFYVLF